MNVIFVIVNTHGIVTDPWGSKYSHVYFIHLQITALREVLTCRLKLFTHAVLYVALHLNLILYFYEHKISFFSFVVIVIRLFIKLL